MTPCNILIAFDHDTNCIFVDRERENYVTNRRRESVIILDFRIFHAHILFLKISHVQMSFRT